MCIAVIWALVAVVVANNGDSTISPLHWQRGPRIGADSCLTLSVMVDAVCTSVTQRYQALG